MALIVNPRSHFVNETRDTSMKDELSCDTTVREETHFLSHHVSRGKVRAISQKMKFIRRVIPYLLRDDRERDERNVRARKMNREE